MPFPYDIGVLVRKLEDQLIVDGLAYDRVQLKKKHKEFVDQLNEEHKDMYSTVMSAVWVKNGGVFLLYGYKGTGKTFACKTLFTVVRCKAGIVFNVVSSDIASLLLPGGRTAHSRFVIPLTVLHNSTCNIKQKSAMTDLIVKTDLIFWDVAPMMNRYCFEAPDRTSRDIMKVVDPRNVMKPFDGKVIMFGFGGDFRQILPVIPKDSRQDIVRATINSSPI